MGNVPTFPIGSPSPVVGPISAEDLARIRALIGSSEPPTDDDLAAALARLGAADEVALEILQGRYAEATTGPAKWSVEGDFSIDNTATITALAKQIAALQTTVDGAPTITVHSLTRSDPWR